MATTVAKLQSERVERRIDLGVFGFGALSLAIALLMTVAGLVAGDDVATAEPAGEIVQAG